MWHCGDFFSHVMSKHYNLSIHMWYCCVFFFYVISNMSNFCIVTLAIQKKVDTTYQNVGFLFNLEQIPRSS